MLLAALIHHYVFNRHDFKSGLLPAHPGGGRLALGAAIISTMPQDVVREAEQVGQEAGSRLGMAIALGSKTLFGGAGKQQHAEAPGEAAAEALEPAAAAGEGPWSFKGSPGAPGPPSEPVSPSSPVEVAMAAPPTHQA